MGEGQLTHRNTISITFSTDVKPKALAIACDKFEVSPVVVLWLVSSPSHR
jgi:hypothetical protein